MATAGIILTGGASRRMGTDKASLVVNGMAMAARLRVVLTAAGIGEIVDAGSAELPDEVTGEGPMAGIVTAWRHLQSAQDDVDEIDSVVVVSCDLPSLNEDVVRRLLEASSSSTSGAVADDGERLQPLVAAYRPAALDAMAAAFAAGERSVRRCFASWTDLATVRFDAELVADADVPDDLADFDVEWPEVERPYVERP